jgi:hypothetical protein
MFGVESLARFSIIVFIRERHKGPKMKTHELAEISQLAHKALNCHQAAETFGWTTARAKTIVTLVDRVVEKYRSHMDGAELASWLNLRGIARGHLGN